MSAGYGYYWWLHPDGSYFASGAFGQQIEIDPAEKIVIAIQSYWPVLINKHYLGYIDTFLAEMKKRVEKERI
jgi:CubicO group peptidase (beta-lactamase class C family)